MFDLATEAHLRRHHQPHAQGRRSRIIPAAIAVNLALWLAVLAAAI